MRRVTGVIVALATAACSAPRTRAQDVTPRAAAPTPLLAPARLAALPAAQQQAWAAYLAASRAEAAGDRESMARELAAIGRTRVTVAPHHDGFHLQPWMTATWLRSDSGQRATRALLTWQTPSGGWSKRLDVRTPREPGVAYGSEGDGWAYVPTIDNDATIDQLRYLARAIAAGAPVAGAPERAALVRGVAYLLRAQFPNGCFPQAYPLRGSYHDAATFNDDATVNALTVLRELAADSAAPLDTDARTRAEAAAALGVECLIASQVVVDGRRTVWGQQHDPLTLTPIAARSYEPVGLSGKESAAIMDHLMTVPSPDMRVTRAVHAAAAWFRQTAIRDSAYDYRTGLRVAPNGGPIWARLTELGTNRPIFSNRDGVKLYDYARLTDRRSGYAWFGTEPGSALRRYDKWARMHPAPDAGAPR